jgi:hypothetical protein
MKKNLKVWPALLFGLVTTAGTVIPTSSALSDDEVDSQIHRDTGSAAFAKEVDSKRMRRGFEISPVPLDLHDKNSALVGLGSYIVNAQSGCNECHTYPSYAPGGDPFQGQPEKVNTAQYLAGGRIFGPFVSANITPDNTGKPAGLTLQDFRILLRTGHNPLESIAIPLQVMPWPVFGKMTDTDIAAIYEYLRAIPSLPNNPNPGQ